MARPCANVQFEYVTGNVRNIWNANDSCQLIE